MKLKNYNWALDGLAALVLLVGAVIMFLNRETMGELVIQLTGVGVLFFTLIRIRPIIKSRNEKDYVLVMFTEMLIDLVIGIALLFFTKNIVSSNFLTFSRLAGVVLYVRGICHFWTTAKRYELHDIVSFIVNIVFISFGFYFIMTKGLDENKVVIAILVLAAFLSGYFGYRTYKGYNSFRIQKMNALKMNEYLDKKEDKTINVDPTHIEEQINPKKIEEPKEDRPSVNVN